MKFKYFLRGLGTGIVFASVICLVAFQNFDSNNISDKEIIERAKELGLVEKEESVKDMFASNTSSEEEKIEQKENKTEDASKKQTEDSSKQETAVEKKTEEKTTEKKSTEEKTTEKKNTEEKTTERKTTEERTTEKGTTENKTVTITIKGGSTSFPVCQKLQELGVIEDATDFDNYLIKHGYANRIRVGTHTLTIGMTYEEIAIAISDPV